MIGMSQSKARGKKRQQRKPTALPTFRPPWPVRFRPLWPAGRDQDLIGSTPAARARWLVEFSERDLRNLRAREWVKLRRQVHSFRSRPAQRLWSDVPAIPRLTGGEILEFQAHVKAGLQRLAEGRPWWIAPKISYGLRITGGCLEADVVATSHGDFSTFEVFETLNAERHRFRFCERCQRPFIARKRQIYCTSRCSQAVRTRRHRTKDPQRFRRWRRERYRRQQQARLGPNIKIATRERSS